MRFDRLVILLIVLALFNCKGTQPTQTTTQVYEEDLSVHRPQLKPVETFEVRTEPVVELTGHIAEELDSITAMISRENLKPRTEQGYTIQLYNGSNREEATKALGRIRIKFPDIEAELSYFQPDFKVKAGQFLDRVVAYETFEEVRREFPNALLIPEKIKINYD